MPEFIENIHDLLVHVVGKTLGEARDDGRLRERYPNLDPDERAVAWVLDGMTLHSLRGLIELRVRQGWKE
jgi:hypothetical protein